MCRQLSLHCQSQHGPQVHPFGSPMCHHWLPSCCRPLHLQVQSAQSYPSCQSSPAKDHHSRGILYIQHGRVTSDWTTWCFIFIICQTLVLYPRPHIITCTLRIWLREIGFALSYGALMLKTWRYRVVSLTIRNKYIFRISVIFRVRSAKAVKITDMDLIKRLGAIVGMFILFLIIRTLMAPPKG